MSSEGKIRGKLRGNLECGSAQHSFLLDFLRGQLMLKSGHLNILPLVLETIGLDFSMHGRPKYVHPCGHSCKVRHGISVSWLKYLLPKVLWGLLVISLALSERGRGEDQRPFESPSGPRVGV